VNKVLQEKKKEGMPKPALEGYIEWPDGRSRTWKKQPLWF